MEYDDKALVMVEEIDQNLIALQEMGYQVTFNTTSSVRHQIATGNKEYFQD